MKHVMRKTTEPVPFTRVKIEDRFWAERIRINKEYTIPFQYQKCKETGRIDAFKLDWKPGMEPVPHIFWDSDVAKWIEAASYSLATDYDPELDALLDEVIDLIASAQQPDGYLNVYFTVVEPKKRWTDLRDAHELYCAGHLIEAGVAHYEATGKRSLLDVVCRYADYINEVFGPEEHKKKGYCGHPEIELALVKLYRTTGEERYLSLSKFFVDERGKEPHYFDEEKKQNGPGYFEELFSTFDNLKEYNQSHKPVREQDRVVGHAVRAMYLYSAMADLAKETGDDSLIKACERLWESLHKRNMYITGELVLLLNMKGLRSITTSPMKQLMLKHVRQLD
ncbi:Non-reducing end beta-L-arabinofuranosidase [Geobacillus sp. BCO2]|nr:Non-reducing end beta-L-arabinofuranosidase [Geobacillus sp. BCO2]